METIRQYGAGRLADAGESVETGSRHLRWCLETGAALKQLPGGDAGAWRAAFDRGADELRSALGWAAGEPAFGAEAHRLAMMLAELSFARGTPGESQLRYEQAAELAADDRTAADALHHAAGAAESRAFGNDALRLHRAAAQAAIRAGDRACLAAAGCRYQWARTLVMRGGPEREAGEAALAEMGATVMAWPPE